MIVFCWDTSSWLTLFLILSFTILTCTISSQRFCVSSLLTRAKQHQSTNFMTDTNYKIFYTRHSFFIYKEWNITQQKERVKSCSSLMLFRAEQYYTKEYKQGEWLISDELRHLWNRKIKEQRDPEAWPTFGHIQSG